VSTKDVILITGSPALQPFLDPYNAAAAEVRQVVAQIFNVPELLVLQKFA